MASVGSFKKVGAELQGQIVTRSVRAKAVRIAPETNCANDNAPSHRVFVGKAEIGAAWSKRSNEGRDYLSVKLDNSSLHPADLRQPVRRGRRRRQLADLVREPQGQRRVIGAKAPPAGRAALARFRPAQRTRSGRPVAEEAASTAAQ